MAEVYESVFATGVAVDAALNKALTAVQPDDLPTAQETAPALWDCDFGTGTPTTTYCFQGHDSSSLSNWASIPAAWT